MWQKMVGNWNVLQFVIGLIQMLKRIQKITALFSRRQGSEKA